MCVHSNLINESTTYVELKQKLIDFNNKIILEFQLDYYNTIDNCSVQQSLNISKFNENYINY